MHLASFFPLIPPTFFFFLVGSLFKLKAFHFIFSRISTVWRDPTQCLREATVLLTNRIGQLFIDAHVFPPFFYRACVCDKSTRKRLGRKKSKFSRKRVCIFLLGKNNFNTTQHKMSVTRRVSRFHYLFHFISLYSRIKHSFLLVFG